MLTDDGDGFVLPSVMPTFLFIILFKNYLLDLIKHKAEGYLKAMQTPTDAMKAAESARLTKKP